MRANTSLIWIRGLLGQPSCGGHWEKTTQIRPVRFRATVGWELYWTMGAPGAPSPSKQQALWRVKGFQPGMKRTENWCKSWHSWLAGASCWATGNPTQADTLGLPPKPFLQMRMATHLEEDSTMKEKPQARKKKKKIREHNGKIQGGGKKDTGN